ncbi:hypothetical protein MMC20_002111 [Loxospora ochrophaea]|nr:hypothetical protein [Loxospora ochrophaea]
MPDAPRPTSIQGTRRDTTHEAREIDARIMADNKVWYDANCHCAAVRYRVKIPSLDEHAINICNCSICTKFGYCLVYPMRDEVIFTQGYDTLKAYRFGRKQKDHLFCPTCGSSLLIDFHGPERGQPDTLAMNARLFKDIDLDKAKYRYFDGKHKLEPPYEF